tara:strand:+ start:1109 stop:1513 length:405 start_codon:yes stop_codon:yes gene_type:complete
MSNKVPLDDDERMLIIQFLSVMHSWFQEEKKVAEQNLANLSLQEGIIKLLFARLARTSIVKDPVFTEAGKNVFAAEDGNTDNWFDNLNRERHLLNAMDEAFTDTELEQETAPIVDDGSNVIDFTARKLHREEDE